MLALLVRCLSRTLSPSADVALLHSARRVILCSAPSVYVAGRVSMSGATDRGQNGDATMPAGPADERLVWVDAEMTGLDVETCHLLEVACLITDGQLSVIAEGPNIIIHQSDDILDNMNDWCKRQHGLSGLTQQVRASRTSLQDAEQELLAFVRVHTPPGKCALAGNSVHADKRFLDKFMPALVSHLHYRIVDVSSVKELCRRWYPIEYQKAPSKACNHRALDDIKESISELNYYRKAIFKSNSSGR